MASDEATALRRQLEAMAATTVLSSPLTVAEQRAGIDAFGSLTAEPDGVSYEPVMAGTRPAEWVVPAGSTPASAVLYLHGGGFVTGSVSMYAKLVGHVAVAAGWRALSLDYRLAPEDPFPSAIEDCVGAFHWLIGQGIENERIVLIGDSSGGNLALATVLRLREEGGQLPGGVVAMSPWIDLTMAGATYRTRASVDLFSSPEHGMANVRHYLGDGDPRDPLASPVFADFSGFPPILIQVGDYEVLLGEARETVEKARRSGVDATLQVWPEMHHVFQLAAGNVPEADQAIEAIGSWIQERMGAHDR